MLTVFHVCLAMKPVEGSFAENAVRHGVAGINVDGCRIGTSGATKRSGQADYPRNPDGTEDRSGCWARTGHSIITLPIGRWPANVCHDGSSEVAGLVPAAGNSFRLSRDHDGGIMGWRAGNGLGFADSGSASRFFQTCEPDPC
jgi:site-specific DNA-methyltransferase (adenine-specific)